MGRFFCALNKIDNAQYICLIFLLNTQNHKILDLSMVLLRLEPINTTFRKLLFSIICSHSCTGESLTRNKVF